jgi:hypothetical protein
MSAIYIEESSVVLTIKEYEDIMSLRKKAQDKFDQLSSERFLGENELRRRYHLEALSWLLGV